MTVQTKTPDIAAADVVGIGKGTGAPTLPQGAHQAVNRTTLTCTWVSTDGGVLIMQWIRHASEDEREDMTKAAA